MTTLLHAVDRISLATLAVELGVSHKTIVRWADVGYCGHRLSSFRLGKKRFTNRQSADQFVAAINGDLAPLSDTPESQPRD